MRKVDTFAPHNDGHQWRKYGEKKINNTNFPRSGPPGFYLFCFFSSFAFLYLPWGERESASACACSEKSIFGSKESAFIVLANLL
jgi:hypothetical protein